MQIRKHIVFAEWMKLLSDTTLKAKILARLNQAQNGNLGDHHS